MIARWFPPDTGVGCFRPLRFCRDLPAMGWQCKVVALAEPCCTYPKASFLAAIPEETEVIRFHCGNLAGHMERIAESPATGAIRTFCAKAVRRTLQEIRMPDIHVWSLRRLFKAIRKTLQQRSIDAILITAPPFSWMTLTEKIKTVCDVPVILDFRDPWTSNVHLYHGRRGRWSHRAERRTLRAADAAIFNTPGAMEYYVETYSNLDQSHWTVITNGFVKEQIDAVEPERLDRTTLVHGGPVGGGMRAGMVCMLVDAMGKLKAAGKITPATFRFISYGDWPANVAAAARECGVAEMIEFRGSRSHNDVLASLKGAAGLLLMLDDLHPRHAPAKMYEYLYLGSEKPILMIGPADSDAARILQQTGAGMTVGATVESIIEGLETVLTGRSSANINTQAVMAYESKALSRKLADLLDAVISRD
ncbi:hypothetical protein LCGC14_0181270 [marine sediment metagenome]|uniref:Glycosyltransferase subfamily 4-like N-terminal domain-containing protein n=1 Tax=marine sediment metagenome TaxID=412755 RepID=A0A0F9UTM6_9ZZZZ